MEKTITYSLPRWRVTRWLAHSGDNVPHDIHAALIASLFGTLPIFAGGVINTLLISLVIAWRRPDAMFIAWFAAEVVLAGGRVLVLLAAARNGRVGGNTHTDIYLVLALLWSASMGYGVFITFTSGDWVIATVAGISSAAMAGGICFRNFSAPRFVATMILLSMGPMCLGAFYAGEPVIMVAFVQIPFYFLSMSLASYRLNKMLVSTMRAERENERRASEDVLTGVANRAGLARALDRKCARARMDGKSVALLYMDLDDFKIVNDTHGHAKGDHVLRLVAERLRVLLRADDVVARLGGDEFVMLAEGVDRSAALRFGEKIIQGMGRPYPIDDVQTVTIGLSVGIALIPEHGLDFEQLLNIADGALYEAKSRGRLCCALAPPPHEAHVDTLCPV